MALAFDRPAWQRKVGTASDRVVELKDELLGGKEELAEVRVAALELGAHIFGPGGGDYAELVERLRAAPR
jgi:hypothetical protein